MAIPPSAGCTWIFKTHNDTYSTITAANGNETGRAVFVSGASEDIGCATVIF
ncbi:uncharacterized protein BDW70DRAFT_165000 [Aspergillus foveolatus]|uniref:uncharacterized protein n=1 Tax=Aspergillus foveolatus TaxID=210207 RepID=UPI003CCD3F20